MRIASLPDFLLQRIDRASGGPVNRQIYQVLRAAILSHQLPAGLQLPSSRELARELAMSRNTVTHAYEQLIAEGYLETRAGAGTFIADTVPDQIVDDSRNSRSDSEQAGHVGLSARGAQLIQRAGVGTLQWGAFMPGRAGCHAISQQGMEPLAEQALAPFTRRTAELRPGRRLPAVARSDRRIPAGGALGQLPHRARSSSPPASTSRSIWPPSCWANTATAPGSRNPATGAPAASAARSGIEPVPIPVDAEGMQVDQSDLPHPAPRRASSSSRPRTNIRSAP